MFGHLICLYDLSPAPKKRRIIIIIALLLFIMKLPFPCSLLHLSLVSHINIHIAAVCLSPVRCRNKAFNGCRKRKKKTIKINFSLRYEIEGELIAFSNCGLKLKLEKVFFVLNVHIRVGGGQVVV